MRAVKKPATLHCKLCGTQINKSTLVDHWLEAHPQLYLEYIWGEKIKK